jgi:antitoxin component of RelBE/YafQ-DinJ toxin-antitoxin module
MKKIIFLIALAVFASFMGCRKLSSPTQAVDASAAAQTAVAASTQTYISGQYTQTVTATPTMTPNFTATLQAILTVVNQVQETKAVQAVQTQTAAAALFTSTCTNTSIPTGTYTSTPNATQTVQSMQTIVAQVGQAQATQTQQAVQTQTAIAVLFTVTATNTAMPSATYTSTPNATQTLQAIQTLAVQIAQAQATQTQQAAQTQTAAATITASNTATTAATQTNTYSAIYTYTSTVVVTNTPVSPYTRPAGWIDDCEDGDGTNDLIISQSKRNGGGYWATYDDRGSMGTSYVWPMSETWAESHGLPHSNMDLQFTMSAPGYSGSAYGSMYAARMTGYVTTNQVGPSGLPAPDDNAGYPYGYMGIGIYLTPTAGEPYCIGIDVSGFTGIRFWAKGDGFTYALKIPYTHGAPEGFTRCDSTQYFPSITGYDDYTVTFTAHAAWGMFQVPFSAFSQVGWGTIVPRTNVLQNLRLIQIQTNDQNPARLYPHATELWIDDVQFY